MELGRKFIRNINMRMKYPAVAMEETVFPAKN
jgi:hypothetical protein